MAYGVITAVDRLDGGLLFTIAAAAFVPAWVGVGTTLIRPSGA